MQTKDKKECCEKCKYTESRGNFDGFDDYCQNSNCPCHTDNPLSFERLEEEIMTKFSQLVMADLRYGDELQNSAIQGKIKSFLSSSLKKAWELGKERREAYERKIALQQWEAGEKAERERIIKILGNFQEIINKIEQ